MKRLDMLIHPIFVRRASCCLMTLLLFACGCNKTHPGIWGEAEVESYVQDQLELDSVDLSPADDGFTGKGKKSDGEEFEITVQQDEASKRLTFEASSNRGEFQEGSFAYD